MLELIRPWAAIAAVVMAIPTTWIYFVKIRSGQTMPHVLTWALLASITFSSALLQLSGGAGWGMMPLLFAAISGYVFAWMAEIVIEDSSGVEFGVGVAASCC